MSERTTTDLLRAVDDTVVGTGLYNIIHPLTEELFERVIDLEGRELDLLSEIRGLHAALRTETAKAVTDALRPPCPTCGGRKVIGNPEWHPDDEAAIPFRPRWLPCPDCVDGKQSWEQVLADVAGWKEAHHKCAEFAVALGAQLSEMHEAVTRLTHVILDEIPGEPAAGEGAIDCAIRLLRAWNPDGYKQAQGVVQLDKPSEEIIRELRGE